MKIIWIINILEKKENQKNKKKKIKIKINIINKFKY